MSNLRWGVKTAPQPYPDGIVARLADEVVARVS
jgi:hypothetical protein